MASDIENISTHIFLFSFFSDKTLVPNTFDFSFVDCLNEKKKLKDKGDCNSFKSNSIIVFREVSKVQVILDTKKENGGIKIFTQRNQYFVDDKSNKNGDRSTKFLTRELKEDFKLESVNFLISPSFQSSILLCDSTTGPANFPEPTETSSKRMLGCFLDL